jgi:hypothetical protein
LDVHSVVAHFTDISTGAGRRIPLTAPQIVELAPDAPGQAGMVVVGDVAPAESARLNVLIVSGYRAGDAQWVLQFNEQGQLLKSIRYMFSPPSGQNPIAHLIGMHDSTMYLVDWSGRVAVYPAL